MKFDNDQEAAIARACREAALLITGGAGTGKTSIIAEIVRRLGNDRCQLLAPTGKAAARIRQATGCDASTIHSWLRYDGEGNFGRTQADRRRLLIDEASMIDSSLLAYVLQHSRGGVVLIGDAAQLSPVGPGQPFHDLLAERPDRVATLITCYRATAAIHHAAQLIRSGRDPGENESSGGETWQVRNTGHAELTQAAVLEIVASGEYDPEQDMILSPRNGDTTGAGDGDDWSTVARLNQEIVARVNRPPAVPWEEGENPMHPFRLGDRVMNTKNDSGRGWYNGDTGTVVAVDTKGRITVALDRDKGIPEAPGVCVPDDWRQYVKLAYALTVHKCQGSQFRRVWFCVLSQHKFMLTRQLIYTAVTRARESCVVLGQPEFLRAGIGRVASRRTVEQVLLARA